VDIDKEILKGYIDTILLCILSKEPLYGYEICKRIRILSSSTFEIKEGTLYIALKRLEKNNLVLGFWNETESSGARRRYYKLTDEGHKHIKLKKSEWYFFKDIFEIFLREVEE
jgi:PadR family transcriptional regulator PadR